METRTYERVTEDLLEYQGFLEYKLEIAENALRKIAEQQTATLEKLRHHGVVFDGPLGADPKNWQDVAFSIYTDLCMVDTWADSALSEMNPSAE